MGISCFPRRNRNSIHKCLVSAALTLRRGQEFLLFLGTGRSTLSLPANPYLSFILNPFLILRVHHWLVHTCYSIFMSKHNAPTCPFLLGAQSPSRTGLKCHLSLYPLFYSTQNRAWHLCAQQGSKQAFCDLRELSSACADMSQSKERQALLDCVNAQEIIQSVFINMKVKHYKGIKKSISPFKNDCTEYTKPYI